MDEIIKIPLLKRLCDIIFALFLIIILSPFFVLILGGILIEHIIIGRPFAHLFYTETRISQGKPFKFTKFNIFKPDVIEDMKRKKIFIHTKPLEHGRDTTIVVGHFLQKIYMDELPQIFAILKGDISFVGPRPVNLLVYQRLIEKGIVTKKIIKTGLTGNFQSHKGEVGRRDYDLDIEYINFCKSNPAWKIVWYDIKIIIRTIKIVLRAEGI